MTPSREAGFDELRERVADLAAAFSGRGHQLHLVGGCVRDAWLGRTVTDLDLTTDARPAEIRDVVEPVADALWTQGERFGTIGARIAGHDVEITTHRTEEYEPGSRKPAVAFADALETDLSRRDFTINALALDAVTGDLVDPHGGQDDLAARVLRTPLDAEVSFTDDPLRILRAGRFLARFELTPVDDLIDAARRLVNRLDIVSVERITDELGKLLATEAPDEGLRFLDRVGVLERVLPEADRARSVDVVEPDPLLRLTALVAASTPTSVRQRLRALRFSNDDVARVVDLVSALHDRPSSPEPATLRRWIDAAGPRWRDAVGLAATLGLSGATDLGRAVADLEAREDLDELSVPVDGADVMAELGLDPGPAVGALLRRLHEHRLDHGPLTRAEALDQLRSWGQP